MPQAYCHVCNSTFAAANGSQDLSCPSCGDSFVEIVNQDTHTGTGRTAGGSTSSRSGTWTFNIPNGMGAVRITTNDGEPTTEFVQQVLGPLFGAGFLNQGANFPGDLHMPAANPADEQAWLDQVITRLMDQYQPQHVPTAQNVLRSLPMLKVRASEAPENDMKDGEAHCHAGECCTVCTDVYAEGENVMELPCQHCFHKECILPWLQGHNTCPICRLALPAGEAPPPTPRTTERRARTSQTSTTNAQQQLPQSLPSLLSDIASAWDLYASTHYRNSDEGTDAGGPTNNATYRRRIVRMTTTNNTSSGGSSRRRQEPRPSSRTSAAENDSALSVLGVLAGGAIGAIAGRVIAGLFASRR